MIKLIRQIATPTCFVAGASLIAVGALSWGAGWALGSILIGVALVGASPFLWPKEDSFSEDL